MACLGAWRLLFIITVMPKIVGHDERRFATARAAADAVAAAGVDGVGTRATLEPGAWPPERRKAQLAALPTPLFASLETQPD